MNEKIGQEPLTFYATPFELAVVQDMLNRTEDRAFKAGLIWGALTVGTVAFLAGATMVALLWTHLPW